jgi:exodeoxyribonuclease VII large subunit
MATQFQHSAPEPVLTVSQLTAEIKDMLETAFGNVWVCGEISNFSRPSSGHCYFTLKDETAQLRAVIWRTAAGKLTCDLADGLEVICQGHLDLYPPRGSYQLVVERLLPKGLGALERALRQLRDKLAAEGLFDKVHKKPLPPFPRRVAFVTSPTGAAIRDFLQVLRRRWQGTDIWIVPVRVQGPGSAQEIAAAIAAVNQLAHPPDILVVGRGGGSLEDLWAFNEEPVVRAIFASRIPVVSAVGHEIDVTLSDLVADVRALTPSEAAERVVPSIEDIRQRLAEHRQRLVAALRGRAAHARSRLSSLAAHGIFRRPLDRLHLLSQRVDELHARQARALDNKLTIARRRTDTLAGRLAALNPTAVLHRGYSITRRTRDGALVRTPADAPPGEGLTTRLGDGEITSIVE